MKMKTSDFFAWSIIAEFNLTTPASKDNKVSHACNSLSVLQPPLVAEADTVCFVPEKGHVTGQNTKRSFPNVSISVCSNAKLEFSN